MARNATETGETLGTNPSLQHTDPTRKIVEKDALSNRVLVLSAFAQYNALLTRKIGSLDSSFEVDVVTTADPTVKAWFTVEKLERDKKLPRIVIDLGYLYGLGEERKGVDIEALSKVFRSSLEQYCRDMETGNVAPITEDHIRRIQEAIDSDKPYALAQREILRKVSSIALGDLGNIVLGAFNANTSALTGNPYQPQILVPTDAYVEWARRKSTPVYSVRLDRLRGMTELRDKDYRGNISVDTVPAEINQSSILKDLPRLLAGESRGLEFFNQHR